jgi:hypothetical protein
MAYTFSEALSTSYYSENKTTLTEVLQLLPDNTNKLITPRDVRDAVFSSWESSVFRYVNVSGVEYIGLFRDEIKDKKILFGKKQISGTNVLDSSLLNSTTADIFFYNTKSDANASQNFRAVFLAGTNSSLFGSAPYLQATQVTSPAFISLNLVNPATQGTIALQSGSSASVVINNLNFPSTSQVAAQIANPSASVSGDLFLAVRSGNIELLTYASSATNLGSPGSTTTIQGNTVTVNGYSLEYTNNTPMLISVGGLSAGSTFSEVPIQLMFDKILYPVLPPFATISITNGIRERRHDSPDTVTINYTVTKRTYPIQTNDIFYTTANGLDSSSISGQISNGTYTYNNLPVSNTDISSNSNSGLFTFSVSLYDGTASFVASQTVEFVYPYIWSYSDADYLMTGGDIGNLFNNEPYTKVLASYGSQSIPISTGSTEKYIFFMYPSIYGALTAIKDGNDFSESLVGGSWTYSLNVSISEQSSRWSTNYNIYKKTQKVIINPSQIYKFIF